jgi:preprotein translocase subunit SecD
MRRLSILVAVLALVACSSQHTRAAGSFRVAGERGIGPTLDLDDVIRGSADATIDPSTGAPVVLMRFTKRGVAKFASLTRNLAQRGAALHRRLHVLISVNGRLISRPYIDYIANPNGISAQTGIEITGVDSKRAAKKLANELNR